MHNNSRGKKQEVKDQRRRVKFSKNKTSVIACNDSLNAKTLNVNFVSAMCDKCMLHDKHYIRVLNSVAKPIKRTVASESNQKLRNFTRKLYERVSKTCSWWYSKFTPSGYKWNPKSRKENVNPNGNDLLTGTHGTDLYSITLQDTNCPNPICLMAKAKSSQAWLWHRRLSHLNFDTINLLSKNDIVVGLPKLKFIKDHLCSSCELRKGKRKYFHTKLTLSSKRRLQLLHMDLCGPMRVASIIGKRHVLVIVDDYSRYTWTRFLRSKDETPKTLHPYFAAEGILHQTSVARTPEQNGVVERRKHTLVEAARTMLSAAKIPLFFWAEAIATACFTQNRSLVIPRHEKTPYHIINDRKPSVKFFYIFGSICYIARDGENLDKIKKKGDECIFVGYSTQSRAYRVFNKRTRVIMESIHVNFAELPHMASDQISSGPAPEFLTLAPTVTSSENINQAITYAENDQVANDEFINIFCTPVQDQWDTSSRHVDLSNMHTFYQ
nr:Gag-Pol polyprotein [Tanacetum cinerariifolium]